MLPNINNQTSTDLIGQVTPTAPPACSPALPLQIILGGRGGGIVEFATP